MGVNDLSFNQLSTVLNSIQNQATGKANLTATTTADFISVAQSTLKQGYDPVLSAISQVLGKTIFAIRPYNAKFKNLRTTNQRFGYITRKLNVVDKPFENDDRIVLTDGQSVDPYKINKPDVLQTNIYGQNVWQKSLTIFKDQLDSAFTGPDQFAEFITMITQNVSDMIEQAHEVTARAAVNNFIAGKMYIDTGSVIHLITEYNALLGLSGESALTKADLFAPDNFKPFMQWVYSRIAELSSLMTERSYKYHFNFTEYGGTYSEGSWSGGTDKSVVRHTPYNRQNVLLYSPWRFQSEAQVLADTFHDNYLAMANVETVNYWQSINTRDTVNVKPAINDESGAVITAAAAVNEDDVFGLIFDDEALGYTVMNEWTGSTPMNPRGGYSNMFWHFTDRYWNDFTENGIVLMMN